MTIVDDDPPPEQLRPILDYLIDQLGRQQPDYTS